MTCSDVRRALPEVLDGGPNGTVAAEFETHVQSCPECSALVSDLKLITSEARQMAASDEPSPEVWLRIAAQLRAEGLIRDPEIREPESAPAAPRPTLVPAAARRRWSAWWLAPVAAGLVAAGSYMVSHKPQRQVAQQQGPATPGSNLAPNAAQVPPTPVPDTTPVPETRADNSAPVSSPAPGLRERKPVPPNSDASSSVTSDSAISADALGATVEPMSSADDQQLLSVVSTRAPSMRATYENQLKAVNSDIRETLAYVKRNPGDADAQQHLMDAYQQKALLYQIALDRIQ